MSEDKWWREADATRIIGILSEWITTGPEVAVPLGFIKGELSPKYVKMVSDWFATAECLQYWLIRNKIDATHVCDLASHVRTIRDLTADHAPDYGFHYSRRCWLTVLSVEMLAEGDRGREPWQCMRVDVGKCLVHLHGEPFPVSQDAADLFAAMIAAKGAPVSASEYSSRPADLYKRLPQQLRELIDSKPGSGVKLSWPVDPEFPM